MMMQKFSTPATGASPNTSPKAIRPPRQASGKLGSGGGGGVGGGAGVHSSGNPKSPRAPSSAEARSGGDRAPRDRSLTGGARMPGKATSSGGGSQEEGDDLAGLMVRRCAMRSNKRPTAT